MKEGMRFVDCDMHVMEPANLFENYLDPKFKDRVISASDGRAGAGQGDFQESQASIHGRAAIVYAQAPWRG